VSPRPRDPALSIGQVFAGSPQILADPNSVYRELQAAGPMHWVAGDAGSGPWTNAWHILGYDETATALKDRRLGAHRMPAPPASPEPLSPAQRDAAELGRIFGLTLLYLDPPDHTRLRLLTAQTFTRRVGECLRPTIVRMVDNLLDRVAAQPTIDIVPDLATPLPILVVADLLGIPAEDQARVAACAGGIMTLHPTPRAMAHALELVHYFRDLLPRRRATPGDDLFSDLLRAQAEDAALSDDEVIAQCITVVIAGTETTTAAIATGVLNVLRHPALWEALGAESISSVVEELLRFDGPTHLLTREAHEAFEIGGHGIAAGQRLWLWVAAANRDPVRFTRPDELIVGRNEGRHLAFGSGIHGCIGASLARLELEMALLALRERYPALRLVARDVTWRPNAALRCPARLLTSTA
jgi:cytochrome P450